jgi:RHS repeat-associated protein
LTSVSSSVSGYNYSSYDALGRITASQQVIDGQTYSMSYQYDLAGNMTSQTYPTGRVVTQSFDNAGRLANISGQASAGTPKTYANAFGYTAHGAVERMRLGNGRWEHTNFNNRLQPTEIGLGSSATDSSVLKLNYEYGTTTNYGNVLKQVITVPTIGTATGFTATQHYQYDQLNRLTGAQEVNGTSSTWQSSGTLWQQKFSYDRYGNRAVDTANTASSMIGPNPQVSTSNNRIVPRTSPVEYYQYDAAGNMTKGQTGETFDYDAENKLVQYQGGATQSGGANYSYDGDGKRVKKATPSEVLTFVYNIAGQLVAEYTTSTPEQSGTSYLTSDTLGTPRLNTKADGSMRARHDYLPSGEELFAGTGGRTTAQGYPAGPYAFDSARQKFTQKERDVETGLDYFGARYYASTQGRFMSIDPLLASGRIEGPQTWNRYAYSLNNPLKYIDPTGMFVWDTSLGGNAADKDVSGSIRDKRKEIRAAIAKANKALNSGKLDSMQKAKLQRALDAYETEGKPNGVTLALGTVDKDAAADTGFTKGQPPTLYDQNTGSLTANVTVTFAKGGSVDGEAFAHEGSHVADRQELVAAFAKSSAGDPSADWIYMPENLTVRQTESTAYRVSAAVAQGLGNNFNPGGYEIWNTGWREADRSYNMQKGIKALLTGSSLYKDKLKDRLVREK